MEAAKQFFLIFFGIVSFYAVLAGLCYLPEVLDKKFKNKNINKSLSNTAEVPLSDAEKIIFTLHRDKYGTLKSLGIFFGIFWYAILTLITLLFSIFEPFNFTTFFCLLIFFFLTFFMIFDYIDSVTSELVITTKNIFHRNFFNQRKYQNINIEQLKSIKTSWDSNNCAYNIIFCTENFSKNIIMRSMQDGKNLKSKIESLIFTTEQIQKIRETERLEEKKAKEKSDKIFYSFGRLCEKASIMMALAPLRIAYNIFIWPIISISLLKVVLYCYHIYTSTQGSVNF